MRARTSENAKKIDELTLKKTQNILSLMRSAITTESKGIEEGYSTASKYLIEPLQKIHHCKGFIVISGVGKAGIIGKKISATMSSIGVKSIWIDPLNALHGDLGMTSTQDIALLLSNSGSSNEIISLAKALANFNIEKIAITESNTTPLAKICEFSIPIGKHNEACLLNLAPTTSTTIMLAIGDALCVGLEKMKKIDHNDYSKYHPMGALGKQSKKASECMRTGDRVAIVMKGQTISEAIIAISESRSGICIITDSNKKIEGIYTDGDFRRDWQKKISQSNTKISERMNTNFKSVKCNTMIKDVIKIMQKFKINSIPVVDNNSIIKGIIDIQDVI